MSVSGIIVPVNAKAAPTVTRIKMPKTATVYVGKKKTLKVKARPKGAKPKIQWKTSNKKIATVSKTGVVKGVKKGRAIITATVKGNKRVKKAQCRVTVKNVLVKSINSENVTLKVGSTTTLKPNIQPADATNKKLKYTSSNTEVVTVDPNMGGVTAKSAGTAVITIAATDGSKKTAKVTVTVTPADPIKATGVSVDTPAFSMGVGDAKVINAVVAPSNVTNRTVSYTSYDPEIATVSGNGLVTAHKEGRAEIEIKTMDGSDKTAKAVVTVKPIQAESISVEALNIGLKAGKTSQINVTFNPTNTTYTDLSYVSSDTSVATVSDTGLITAVKDGSATITVKTEDGSDKSADINVVVNPTVAESMTVSIAKPKIEMGEKIQIKSDISPSTASVKTLKYTLVNPLLDDAEALTAEPYNGYHAVTVSNTGIVEGIRRGPALIRVETVDGSDIVNLVRLDVDWKASDKTGMRVFSTNDGEKDDIQSFRRFLLYTNEMDVEAIVLSSSRFHAAGIPERVIDGVTYPAIPAKGWVPERWINDLTAQYEEGYENLVVHDPNYPTPDGIRAAITMGNVGYAGEVEASTDGSLMIKEALLDDDPRKVQFQVWGGTNTFARALMDIEEDYFEKGTWTGLDLTTGTFTNAVYTRGEFKFKDSKGNNDPKKWSEWESVVEKVNSKAVLYIIMGQDNSYEAYVEKYWPGITSLYDNHVWGSMGYQSLQQGSYYYNWGYRGDFLNEHITSGHGVLLGNYIQYGDNKILADHSDIAQDGRWNKAEDPSYTPWTFIDEYGVERKAQKNTKLARGDMMSEGDTPAFIYALDRGLRSQENATWGGWAGRLGVGDRPTEFTDGGYDYCKTPFRPLDDPEANAAQEPWGWQRRHSASRWVGPLQTDFAVRADWFVTPNYEGANHMPDIRIVEGVDLEAAAGERVLLNARTSDPDGDRVDIKWWHYGEADTYKERSKDGVLADGSANGRSAAPEWVKVVPGGKSAYSAAVYIPSDAQPGDTIHVIAEATDNGAERGKDHNLKYYQRIVIKVTEACPVSLTPVKPMISGGEWDEESQTFIFHGTGEEFRQAFSATAGYGNINVGTGFNATTVLDGSSDTSVFTVTGSGTTATVTPVGPGCATLNATMTIDGRNSVVSIRIKVDLPSASDITLAVPENVNPDEIPLGEDVLLTAEIMPKEAKQTLTWFSSNPDAAIVDAEGRVTPIEIGSTTITAKATDGSNIEGRIDLKIVGKKAESLDVELPKTNLVMGETVQINASVSPSAVSDKTLKYTSSDPYAATVSDTGLITALAKGFTTITVETVDGSELKEEVDLTIDYDLEKESKIRTIVTSDGEADDKNSLRRLMLYANEMDLEGFVLSSSQFHWAGDPEKGVEAQGWHGIEKCVNDLIEQYEKIYENLRSHDPDFPTPNYYRKICVDGNIKWLSEMDGPTEGSELIKKAILDDDPRQLYLQAWGGPNTIAMALKSIEDDYRAANHSEYSDAQWDAAKATDSDWIAYRDGLSEKITMFLILEQDTTYKEYIAPTWPNIEMIIDGGNFWRFAYQWKANTAEDSVKLGADWLAENIKFGHGPLMDEYFLMGDGTYLDDYPDIYQRGLEQYLIDNPQFAKYDFVSEGDSPAFFYLLDRGLRSLENPAYGGWGGRFGLSSRADDANRSVYRNNVTDYNPNRNSNTGEKQYTLTRWIDNIQSDFAARADWCITPNFEDVNHMPNMTIKEGLDITAKPGEVVMLRADATDPDGDRVDVQWWNYCEAGTYAFKKQTVDGITTPVPVNMIGASSKTVKVEIPEDAKNGDTIHIIAQATDNGEHNLKYYQRVIITVEDN